MKTTTIFFLLLTILVPPCLQSGISQQASTTKEKIEFTPLLSQTLGWMIGDWEGEGVQGGSSFTSSLSVTTLLDGAVLQISRASESGLKEMMLLGYDVGSKKHVGVLYDSRNHIGLFSCELKDKMVDFSQIAMPQGYVSRRVFQMLQDGGMLFFIEKAEPQQPLSKTVEITYKKK
jgi:hypothetical protein